MSHKYIALLIQAIIFSFVMPMTGCRKCEGQPNSRWPGYFHKSQENCGVIVFVHGVLGDGTSTWTNPKNQAFWPQLLKDDPDSAFNGYDIYVYEYKSPKLCQTYSIDEVAEDMWRYFKEDKVIDGHQTIVFLNHSMGGLVTRAYINKYGKDFEEKIGFLYFFSTPTTGSELAKAAEILSRNSQFKGMAPIDDEQYLGSLQSTWLAAGHKFSSHCAYEIVDTLPGQKVVERQSATNLCGERLDPIAEDHMNIVKPEHNRSSSYLAFKQAFNKSAPISKAKLSALTAAGNTKLENLELKAALQECDKALCIDPTNKETLSLREKILGAMKMYQ